MVDFNTSDSLDKVLYPEATANKTGFLNVSSDPKHDIYWEEYGNPDGAPALVIHGGPGGACSPIFARFFDPEHYRIIHFDQRGCGKSTPHASLEDNSTHHLIADINKLREHLGVTGKMHLFGGSWGSTLALSYAIFHPDNVQSMALRGIFLCRKRDLDFFYQGDAADRGNPTLMGAGRFMKEMWDQYVEFIPASERGDMIAAYNKRLCGDDEDVLIEAAKRWSIWEGLTCQIVPDYNLIKKFGDPHYAAAFARIENHYFLNSIFLGKDGAQDQNYIIENVDKIKDIPTEIVHGRYDMVCPRDQADDLVAAWHAVQPDEDKQAKLHITDDAGHTMFEPSTAKKLVEFTNRFKALD